MVMIDSEGSEKKRAVPSAPKPKTLKDCLIRNVSAVMRYNFSRVVNDVFLPGGLQISDEPPATLKSLSRVFKRLSGLLVPRLVIMFPMLSWCKVSISGSQWNSADLWRESLVM
jgi:hypothetical protein